MNGKVSLAHGECFSKYQVSFILFLSTVLTSNLGSFVKRTFPKSGSIPGLSMALVSQAVTPLLTQQGSTREVLTWPCPRWWAKGKDMALQKV